MKERMSYLNKGKPKSFKSKPPKTPKMTYSAETSARKLRALLPAWARQDQKK